VVIVGVVAAEVEAVLVAGGLACPECGGVLARWGHARARALRRPAGVELLRPRRAICRERRSSSVSCGKTHVLLPEVCLVRRRDEVAVIGEALLLAAGGQGHRSIARRLRVPPDTVRGWLRRLRARAAMVRAYFLALAVALDPVLGRVGPAGGALADAVEAIGIVVRAWTRRFGARPVWRVASLVSGGLMLAHTACPFPRVP
jgi:hypothetical protein